MSTGNNQSVLEPEVHPGPNPHKGVADKYRKSFDAMLASRGLLDVAEGRVHRKALELVPIDIDDFIANEPPRASAAWFRWAELRMK